MSDEKLRELERRSRESGEAGDELAWLRERARSGEKLDWESYSRLHVLSVDAAAEYLASARGAGLLSSERVEFACRAGHAPACRALGIEKPSLADPVQAVVWLWTRDSKDALDLLLSCLAPLELRWEKDCTHNATVVSLDVLRAWLRGGQGDEAPLKTLASAVFAATETFMDSAPQGSESLPLARATGEKHHPWQVSYLSATSWLLRLALHSGPSGRARFLVRKTLEECALAYAEATATEVKPGLLVTRSALSVAASEYRGC